MMSDDSPDSERLQREIDYYRRQLDELTGENFKLDVTATGLRHELKKKLQGFALLTGLQQAIGAHQEVESIFEIVIEAINSTLGMDKTVVLTPADEEYWYRPSQWIGFPQEETERFASMSIRFPSEFAGDAGLLLVNKSSEPTVLVEEIRAAFALPYFVCLPVMGEDAPIGLLLSGRLMEAQPFFPPLDQGDVDTFQAIADLVAAFIGKFRMAVLEERNRQIQEASERKSRFLANMSHELRTPMNAIMGFTGIVLRKAGDVLPARQQENLTKVIQSAEHLLELINSLLDLSKIEAGRMDVNAERFEVEKLIGDCCAEVSPLVKPGVELRCDVAEGVGEARTDKGRVRQIVINLLSNALKFTGRGEVVVRVAREGAAGEEAILVIEVADTGAGIPAEALDTIFEEFRQVKGADPQRKGMGLGLPITKGFAELLGGSIGVASEAGKGSTFSVRMPLVYRGDGQTEEDEGSLEYPPAEELIPLFERAQKGQVVAVREQIDRIAALDGRYGPLVARLREFSGNFDMEGICDLLAPGMDG